MASDAATHGFDILPIVVLLGSAVVAVPFFKKIGLGSVLGYLTAGLVIGPFGIGMFHDPQTILHVAELGVVLFLFIIGLEMQPSRLWQMRGEIFGLGLAQVLTAIVVLTIAGLALGLTPVIAFVAGTGFVLTSTAIVMQMLQERGSLQLPKGRRIVSILLLEDLAIVPLLAIVAILGPAASSTSVTQFFATLTTAIAAIVGLIVAGRYLLDPMFRILARSNAREVMTAAALLVVLGAALLMQLGGLSMAMGAFLAGVLLSESSFRHQLESDIEPFRGILLGLFFLSVGMALDLSVIAQNWPFILLSVATYLLLKFGVIFSIARLFKAKLDDSLERAVLMAQGGEFAFVLFGTAASVGILNSENNAILTATVILSMALTPLMIILYDQLAPKAKQSMEGVEVINDVQSQVLLIGFGRVGQIISQPLLARGHAVTIIETDTQAIRDAQEYGFKVYYGDGSRLDILHAAGVSEAKAIIIAVNDPKAATNICELARHEFPHVPIVVRASDRQHAIQLVKMGLTNVVRETYESAMLLASKTLPLLGDSEEDAAALMSDVRALDQKRLEMELIGGEEAAISLLHNNVGNKTL